MTRGPDHPHDDVLARRARIKRWVDLGQRVGYTLFLVAIVAFFVGFAGDFTDALVSVIVVSMVVGSVILAPAIVFAYGVKAAERDDAEQGRPTMGERGRDRTTDRRTDRSTDRGNHR